MKARIRRNAFTLVEVLLVVVIMAILAATVIPSFNDSSMDAKESTLSFNLNTLRSQIELYKVHHNGKAPDTITSGVLEQLTKRTDASGATGSDPATYPYGPYLVNGIPENPIGGSNVVTAQTGTPTTETGAGGWLYDTATGEIWADSDGYLTW